jgi:putative lipoic acid-binding regulatory protein
VTEPIDEAGRRARALQLLEANHVFPGEFTLSVIAFGEERVTVAILAAAWPEQPRAPGDDGHQTVPSAQGKYVSHRLRVKVQSAHEVLALFARLRAVDGVVTVL